MKTSRPEARDGAWRQRLDHHRPDRPDAQRRHVLAQLLAVAPAMLLASCGGGGAEILDVSSTSPQASALVQGGKGRAGLLPGDAQIVDSGPLSIYDYMRSLAVGRLPDGGHAIVWRRGVDGLWVRRFDASGQPAGDRQPLALPDGVNLREDVAALVRRDGSIVLAFTSWQPLDPLAVQVRYDLRTRHFDAAGNTVGDDHTVESLVVQTISGVLHPATLTRPQMAQWKNGDYVVAWQIGARVPHSDRLARPVQARHMDGDGQPAGPVQDLGLSGNWPFQFGLQLVTLDEGGGWLARTGRRVPDVPGWFAHFEFFEAARALALSDEMRLPFASFVLDLPDTGAVLFSGERAANVADVYALVSPFSQWYNRAGYPAGPAQPLTDLPVAAVALVDGSYVVFQPDTHLAQRYSPQGHALGAPLTIDVSLGHPHITEIPLDAAVFCDALPQGGMAMTWTSGADLLTRRFEPT